MSGGGIEGPFHLLPCISPPLIIRLIYKMLLERANCDRECDDFHSSHLTGPRTCCSSGPPLTAAAASASSPRSQSEWTSVSVKSHAVCVDCVEGVRARVSGRRGSWTLCSACKSFRPSRPFSCWFQTCDPLPTPDAPLAALANA